ncbi:MAG: outer membrane protein assembly factor BamA [Deltaproteobacteria bacterium]|nr:outer membrane protein assembly factor BamA [Deltaproteobacteria bacterium]TLN03561.1 MAG: outer membrane protein assembly factor BamA [bacterium]
MLIAFLTNVLCPAILSADNEKISDIVITGNESRETASIIPLLKSKVGDSFSAEKTNEDVKSIYRIGIFQDVTVESVKTEKGISLVYTVVEKPFVRAVSITGNKEIASDKLRDAIELKNNSVFSGGLLAKSEKKIKSMYADEGYYLAEVSSSTTKSGKNGIRVTFTVKEGEKVLIKKIAFEGNTVFSQRKLRKQMETKEKWFLSWITGSGTYKEEVLKTDVNRVADLYYNNGYINVKVGEPKVELLPDKSGLVVTIGITEGEQFRTGTIDFKGDLLESKEVLQGKVKLKSGETFSREVLRGDVFSLTDVYADKGYAFTNVNPLSKIDPDKKIVDITFDFEKGEKIYIDKINVSGNTKTRDKVIRREFRLAEGDLYSSTALKRTKQNLSNLGFFEEASIAPVKGSASNKLNLNTEVKEKSTGQFSIGAGYSSSDGIIGQGSIQQSNFLGLGLKGTLSASLGGKTQLYNIGITDPYFLDTNWTLGFDVYRSEREYEDYTRRVTGGDIKAGYRLSDQLSTFWLYKYEVKSLFDFSPGYENNPSLLTESSGTIGSLYGSINLDKTDYRLDPSSGYAGTLSAEYAGLGGNQRFARFIGQASYFYPLIWNTVFSLRGELGYMMRIGKNIPIDEKFYLGGISTLRGYSSRTVSPTNTSFLTSVDPVTGVQTSTPTTVYLGGIKEAVLNAEYVFPIIKDAGLKGVAFFDAGNSYGPGEQYFSKVLMSYGLGVRWYSPMGPLRLEYGIPVNPREGIDSKSGKFEFSIGGFF